MATTPLDINVYDGALTDNPGKTIIEIYPTRTRTDGYLETVDTVLAREALDMESPIEDTWIHSDEQKNWPADIRDSIEIVTAIEKLLSELPTD